MGSFETDVAESQKASGAREAQQTEAQCAPAHNPRRDGPIGASSGFMVCCLDVLNPFQYASAYGNYPTGACVVVRRAIAAAEEACAFSHHFC